MDLSIWRDIILIIWGLVATVAIVFIAVILFLFYRRMVSVLDSTDLLVDRVGGIVDYVDKELVTPIRQLGTMVQGIIQGVSIFSSIFRRKED